MPISASLTNGRHARETLHKLNRNFALGLSNEVFGQPLVDYDTKKMAHNPADVESEFVLPYDRDRIRLPARVDVDAEIARHNLSDDELRIIYASELYQETGVTFHSPLSGRDLIRYILLFPNQDDLIFRIDGVTPFQDSDGIREGYRYLADVSLWEYPSSDLLTPFRLSIAVVHSSSFFSHSNVKDFYTDIGCIRIKQAAYAVARFPRIFAEIQEASYLASASRMTRRLTSESNGNETAFAWASLSLLSSLNSFDDREERYQWCVRALESGLEFDKVVPYVQRGIWDINSIRNAIDMDIDASLLANL